MSDIVIEVYEPGEDPLDITNSVLFRTASFEQQMNAVPGSFSVQVRDPERVLEFHTGWEIALYVDGWKMFGGYINQVYMGSMAPAADTSNLSDYQLRLWTLRGADYNLIFDRRVWRNEANYLRYITVNEDFDGAILRDLVDNYADLSDFSSSGIEDIAAIDGDVVEQGKKIRTEFEQLSFFGGAVWYVDPTKTFIYKPYEDVVKRWGFSDVPNNVPITASPDEFQDAYYGFRDVEALEDGSYIQNDALIWGGSEFAGSSGGTVFAREENPTSQSTYGRWQMAETHFGERKYAGQAQVDARASVIVNGPPGADIFGQQKGLRYSQWQFTFSWNSTDVPLLTGDPDHIVPGDLVTIDMQTFGVTKLLPLRSLRTSFPDALVTDGDPNDRVVLFTGTFGLQLSDPFTLWRYLLSAQNRVVRSTPTVVDDTSTVTVYGAQYNGVPTPAPDDVETVFSIQFGYIASTLQVYKNGLHLTPVTDYTESDNEAGEFTMTVAPASSDTLYVVCATLEA